MEEVKIDGIKVEDYGRPTSQSFYPSNCKTIDLSNQPKAKLTCGIEKLKTETVYDRNYLGYVSNVAIGQRYPDNKELMNKINEIIDYLDNQINYKLLGDE